MSDIKVITMKTVLEYFGVLLWLRGKDKPLIEMLSATLKGVKQAAFVFRVFIFLQRRGDRRFNREELFLDLSQLCNQGM